MMIAAWVLFWVCAGFVAYTLVGYPVLNMLLASLCPVRVIKSEHYEPSITFIIAAYNEEPAIGETVRKTLCLDYPKEKLEIIVASDGSTDRTDEIVRGFEDDGVKLIRVEGRLGKTATVDHAVKQSTGDVLVCTDATTRLTPDTLRKLVANLADPGIGAVSGRIVYDYDQDVLSKGFRPYQTWVVRQRTYGSRYGFVVHLCGAIHAVRRDCYEPSPLEVSTELALVLHVARRGLRTVYEPDAVGREDARPNMGTEFRARLRISIQTLTFMKLLIKEGIRGLPTMYLFQLFSFKICRWGMPVALLALLISSALLALGSPIFAWIAAGQAALYGLGLLGWAMPALGKRLPGVSAATFFVATCVAYLISWYRLFRGKTQPRWEPDREQ